ncbi:MAG TPA: DUF1206 domain-containing protein [archaeon]|nr:DUF1206 domain-containing protein [archaeon]
MEVLVARIGLTARGLVYILLGVLALLVARGAHAEVDQGGVLAQILVKPDGKWLVGALAVGFASYALWRFWEALSHPTGGHKVRTKFVSFVRGVIYAGLAYTAIAVLHGSRQHQSTQQRDYAGSIMSHTGGRWLVGLVGFVLLVVGMTEIAEGIKLKFLRYFHLQELSSRVRRWIRDLGRIGTVARGFVFSITGLLVIAAAWTHDASKATGLDGALKTLREQPFGGLLLGVVAAGLVIFGIYGLSEARYRWI